MAPPRWLPGTTAQFPCHRGEGFGRTFGLPAVWTGVDSPGLIAGPSALFEETAFPTRTWRE